MDLWTSKTRLGVLAGLLGLTAAYLPAQTSEKQSKRPVLLELFTSEGCSSCPPADRLLAILDQQQPVDGAELIVLSEHVDYWNHLGWKDPFSAALFSERQESYAKQLRTDDVYTPQVIVDGQRQAVGNDAAAIRNAVNALSRNAKAELTVSNLVRTNDRVALHLTSEELSAKSESATVYVALADEKDESSVTRGENGGHSLTHVSVVRVLVPVGELKHGKAFSKDVDIPIASAGLGKAIRIVAFLQGKDSKKIVAVTQTKLGA